MKNKFIITVILIQTGVLGWSTYSNFLLTEERDMLLLEKEQSIAQFRAAIVPIAQDVCRMTTTYICTKFEECKNFLPSKMEEFCSSLQ